MLKLIYLFFIIFYINKGITVQADIPDIAKDGFERSRVSNIERCNQYILWAFENDPTRNILLTSLAQDYNIGFIAVTANDKNKSDSLASVINYENKEQILSTMPYIASEIGSLGYTTSVWGGAFFADSGRMFKRSFIDTCYTTFNSLSINSDFGNPNLAAMAINLWGISATQGYSENGEIVSSDDIGPDGRLLSVGYNYFEGTFDNTCETIYQNFTLACGNTIQLPTMHVQGSHGYARRDDLNAEIYEITFSGGNFTLRVVKPQSNKDIPNILNKFQHADCYDEAFSNLTETELDIFIPEMDIHQVFDFKENFEEVLNNSISEIDFEGVYENANDARLTEAKVNLRMKINRDCSDRHPTDTCTERNSNSQVANLNSVFLFYVVTKNEYVSVAGIFLGR